MWLSKVCVLMVLAAAIHTSWGLKAADVGKWDWYKENIGEVSTAQFVKQGVVVASTRGALALLDSATGSTMWRRTLQDINAVLTSDKKVLSFSQCSALEVWNIETGLPVSAEAVLPPAPSADSPTPTPFSLPCTLLPSPSQPDRFLLLSPHAVQLRTLSNGALVEDYSAEDIQVSKDSIFFTKTSTSVPLPSDISPVLAPETRPCPHVRVFRDTDVSLYVCQDASLVSINSQNSLLWSRPEGLAHIQKAEFVDLPAGNASMVQDKNGFDKIIAATSTQGSLYALRTIGGKVLWSVPLWKGVQEKDWAEFTVEGMFVTRAQHHTRDAVAPEISVVYQHKTSGKVVVTVIDVITGSVFSSTSLEKSLIHAFALPFPDDKHRMPLVLVHKDLSVSLLPHDGCDAVKTHLNRIYFHLTDTKTSTLTGYALTTTSGAGSCVSAVEAWKKEFVDRIVGYAINTNRNNANIASAATLVGEGRVLVKYLNPHLVAVATEHRIDGKKTGHVMVHVMDGVTGQVVHSAIHAGYQGPVAIVIEGNSMVYSVTNTKAKRYEIISTDLFLNTTSSPLGKEFSSFDRLSTYALSKAYVFPYAVSTVSTSQTIHGVTLKNFLFGLSRGQIHAITKRLLDVRRPLGAPSTAESEEGLLPYSPALPFVPSSVISHVHTVNGLHRIVSAPTHLESTSHVLGVGLDLFYTRFAPSTYDRLSEDFQYGYMVLSVVAMAVATLAAKWWAGQRALKTKWMQ